MTLISAYFLIPVSSPSLPSLNCTWTRKAIGIDFGILYHSTVSVNRWIPSHDTKLYAHLTPKKQM